MGVLGERARLRRTREMLRRFPKPQTPGRCLEACCAKAAASAPTAAARAALAAGSSWRSAGVQVDALASGPLIACCSNSSPLSRMKPAATSRQTGLPAGSIQLCVCVCIYVYVSFYVSRSSPPSHLHVHVYVNMHAYIHAYIARSLLCSGA